MRVCACQRCLVGGMKFASNLASTVGSLPAMPLTTTLRPLDGWPQARAWVDRTLAAHGLTATEPPSSARLRPWSMVARLPVGDDVVWFKANGRGSRYEAALIEALARWVPDQSIAPMAIDAEHGWSLLPDGGPTLRESPADVPRQWEAFLRVHAQLQLDLVGHVGEMIGFGVPHLPVESLPGRLDALLDDPAVWAKSEAGQRRAVAAQVPAYREACAELAAGVIPVSLQHDDLHDGNVFVRDGYRFFDWGDAYLGHPFALLLVGLRVAADRFTLPHGDPALLRLRDAYLEPWSSFAPHAQLAREVELAMKVAKVARALSWQRALLDAESDALTEWGDAVPGWLTETLEPDVI